LPIRIETVDVLRIKKGNREELRDFVSVEEPLTIFVNGEEVVTLLSTPSFQKQLAVGFLFSEGILNRESNIESLRFYKSKGVVNVNMDGNGDISKRLSSRRVITSGCCGGTSFYTERDIRNFDKTKSSIKIAKDDVMHLIGELTSKSIEFKKTGGVHSAALAKGKEIILFREDIGRHNAIDKIIGECFLSNISTSDGVVLTSGRITSEITRKIGAAGVAIIISKSAPTSLAIKMAKELGITLIGFARSGRMNIYSNKSRVVEETV